MTKRHLHREDYPETLAVLNAVVGDRTIPIVWEPTEVGAHVDFDAAHQSFLSTTEVAVFDIARGLHTLEWHGGPPPRVAMPLRTAIEKVTAR